MDTSDHDEDGAAVSPKNPRKRRPAPAAAREAHEVSEPAVAANAPAASEPEAPIDPDLPAFARAYPRDEELDELVRAFERGDYARVRREAPALADRASRSDVKKAARDLRRRLDPDPIAVYLLSASALLLAFLAIWYWGHGHEVVR